MLWGTCMCFCCCLTGVVTGQRWWPCHGRHITVWAVCQGAGSHGAKRSVETLLPQRDLCSVAWSRVWSSCYQPYLSADRSWSQVRRVPMWEGELLTDSTNIFTDNNLYACNDIQPCSIHIQCESKKSHPAVFWYFSQTDGNFLTD